MFGGAVRGGTGDGEEARDGGDLDDSALVLPEEGEEFLREADDACWRLCVCVCVCVCVCEDVSASGWFTYDTHKAHTVIPLSMCICTCTYACVFADKRPPSYILLPTDTHPFYSPHTFTSKIFCIASRE